MAHVLSDVLSAAEARALFEAAAALPFEDGAKTAGRLAKRVKDNQQAADGTDTQAVLARLERALLAHPVFGALAYPKSFAKLLVSRTEGGGQYGAHVDNALMNGARTDLSFTLFLTPPEDYVGGELVIMDGLEDRAVKLGQGELILYPSDSLHRVEPVTEGARLVIVGWVQSFVSDPRAREILFDLWTAASVAEAAEDFAQVKRISKARSNLLRMWAV